MSSCDVLIGGGGPVGLLLGCLLAQRGIDVRVLESRPEPSWHSRAIGIHPPGLRCLEAAGLAQAFLAQGVAVRRGQVFGASGKPLGSVDFACLGGDYPFVLSLPEAQSERLLGARLEALAPGALQRGARVVSFVQDASGCHVESEDARGQRQAWHAHHAIACDGKHSALRSAAGIGYPGKRSGLPFVMADGRDDTSFGSDAAVFLGSAGLVESFPLPGRTRRWVMSVCEPDPSRANFASHVARRTGQRLDATSITMLSAFEPEHYLARRFALGRLFLAGDAAHVLSPIGGQGMNVGFEDALALADALEASRENGWRMPPARARAYARTRRRAARRATLRAELYTRLGTSGAAGWSQALVRAGLAPRFHDLSAQMFAMGG
jgi:2-polyprenyl-6-methoxyphenol hydroxylase-like FAD-dependent oxidoreductase